MRSTLSCSRWILLLSLALLTLLSESEVESLPAIHLPCCYPADLTDKLPARITTCYEQKPRPRCRAHAFLIIDKRNITWCVEPSEKLSERLKKEWIQCPPDVSAAP